MHSLASLITTRRSPDVVSVDTDLMKGTSTTFETFTFTSFEFSENSNGGTEESPSVVSSSKNSSTYGSSANNSYNGNSSYFGSVGGEYPSDPAPSTNPYNVTESVWQGIMELDTYSYYSFDYESLTNVNGGSPTKNTYTYSYHNNKYTYESANNIQSSFYAPFNPVDLPHIALEQSILWLVSDSSQMLNYSNYSFDGTEYCYVFTTDSYVNIAVMVAFENNVLERITVVSSQDTSDGLVSKTETFTFYDWE